MLKKARVLATILVASSTVVHAQDKVDEGVIDNISKYGSSRVIIALRAPKIGQSSSFAFAAPTSFVSQALGDEGKNIKRISGLPLVVAETNEIGIAELRANPEIERVFADEPVAPLLFDSSQISGAVGAWALGYRGKGQTVAVLDTGVSSSHEFLNEQVVSEACFSTSSSTIYELETLCPNGLDTSTKVGSAQPCEAMRGCDHGTHVAGIVAGKDATFAGRDVSGIAPEASVIAVQVFTKFNDSRVCGAGGTPCIRSFPSDQLRALEHIRNLSSSNAFSVAAVNMSLGGGRHEVACDDSSPLTNEVEVLRNLGIATVIASGNDGFYNAISAPACISKSISVGATTKQAELDIRYSNTSPDVDFVSPGTLIVSSAGPSYTEKSGTSMATPHVAGYIAVLKSVHAHATVDQIERVLRETADRTVDPRTGQVLFFPKLDKAVQLMSELSEQQEMTSTGTAGQSSVGVSFSGTPQRVVIEADPTTPYGNLRQAEQINELLRSFGDDSVIRPMSNNKFILENEKGISAAEAEKFLDKLGNGVRIFEDSPRMTQ